MDQGALLVLSGSLAWTGLAIVFGQKRETPMVIMASCTLLNMASRRVPSVSSPVV